MIAVKEVLLGQEISQISFFESRLELRSCDYHVLRIYTNPVISIGNVEYTFPQPSSGWALQSLIMQVIQSIEISTSSMEVMTDKRARLVIPIQTLDWPNTKSIEFIAHEGTEPVSPSVW